MSTDISEYSGTDYSICCLSRGFLWISPSFSGCTQIQRARLFPFLGELWQKKKNVGSTWSLGSRWVWSLRFMFSAISPTDPHHCLIPGAGGGKQQAFLQLWIRAACVSCPVKATSKAWGGLPGLHWKSSGATAQGGSGFLRQPLATWGDQVLSWREHIIRLFLCFYCKLLVYYTPKRKDKGKERQTDRRGQIWKKHSR